MFCAGKQRKSYKNNDKMEIERKFYYIAFLNIIKIRKNYQLENIYSFLTVKAFRQVTIFINELL